MRPLIAIVGRPNVGKSTLLNRLAGRLVALVADTPGVTRDRLWAECRLAGREVLLVDTGGFCPDPRDEITRSVVEHAREAVAHADLVLFLGDARAGLHPLDQSVADMLRKSRKTVLFLANKSDPGAREREEWEFHRLGLQILAVSALHGTGLEELAEAVAALLPPPAAAEEPPHIAVALKMCLLGRPNVGKSSLCNALIGEERQITSPTPGTTRDSVDLRIRRDGLDFLLVDTPGVRRKRSIGAALERMSVLAALRSLERADVAVAVLDGQEDFSDQDARLLRLVHDRGRGLIVAVNKIDLWNRRRRKEYLEALAHGTRFVSYAPVLEVSALTGAGIERLLPRALQVQQSRCLRISTGDLNRFVEESISRLQPPAIRGRRARIYYITQAEIRPPTFVAWVNDPARLPRHYQRYLENRLRDRFPFPGSPLRWIFRKRGQKSPESRLGGRGGRRKRC